MADTHNVFISHRHEDDALVGQLKDLLARNGVQVRDSSITSDNPNQATSEAYIKQILGECIKLGGEGDRNHLARHEEPQLGQLGDRIRQPVPRQTDHRGLEHLARSHGGRAHRHNAWAAIRHACGRGASGPHYLVLPCSPATCGP